MFGVLAPEDDYQDLTLVEKENFAARSGASSRPLGENLHEAEPLDRAELDDGAEPVREQFAAELERAELLHDVAAIEAIEWATVRSFAYDMTMAAKAVLLERLAKPEAS